MSGVVDAAWCCGHGAGNAPALDQELQEAIRIARARALRRGQASEEVASQLTAAETL